MLKINPILTEDITSAINTLQSNLTLTSLYSGTSYNTTTTLSDSAENYTLFVIKIEGNQYTSAIKAQYVPVVNPNGATFSHHVAWYDGSGVGVRACAAIFSISGNTITLSSENSGVAKASTAYNGNANCLKITEVWGLKIPIA